jgi:hypothetical protein
VKNIIVMLGVFMITGAIYQSALAEPSPMVQQHIFAPDQGLEPKAAPVAPIDPAGLEKDMIFTGVLLTPKGKQAILAETGKNEKGAQKQKHIMKEGDSIKGMAIKEIGSNYLLLSSNESLVRIKLYAGIKSRPIAPPDTALADAGSAANPTGAVKLPPAGNQPQNAVPAPPGSKMDMKSRNASGGNTPPIVPVDNNTNAIFGGGGENPGQQEANPPASSNPFLDVIKRSAENARSGGAVANPFTGQ